MDKLFKMKGLLVALWIISLSSPNVLADKNTQQHGRIANARKLPPIIFNDLDGQPHNLYDWHGKVILLNFWATWCRACRIEIPELIEYQLHYAERGLQVIGVGIDEVSKLRNYGRTVGINYPILQTDPGPLRPLFKQWGNPHGLVPFTVIVDRDGHVVFKHQGIFSKQAFASIVEPLLDP